MFWIRENRGHHCLQNGPNCVDFRTLIRVPSAAIIAQNSDPRVSMNFNLKSEEVSVAYLGKRGACIKQIRASGLDIVTRMKPSVVLVQGVSNDLCEKTQKS